MGGGRRGRRVSYDDGEHAKDVFLAREETSHEEDYDGDWNGSDGEVEFDVRAEARENPIPTRSVPFSG